MHAPDIISSKLGLGDLLRPISRECNSGQKKTSRDYTEYTNATVNGQRITGYYYQYYM